MLRTTLCLPAASFVTSYADPVSREAPALYETDLKPLLTAAEPLLKKPASRESADKGGEVVLLEQIVHVDDAARRWEVSHSIYRATAESGVEAIPRDVEHFHKKRSRILLPLARTVQEDGRSLPVRGEAAFIQTPPRSADADLYDDQGELVVIYPDIKKGSAAESIVLREEVESRIPGQFTMMRSFSAGWPIVKDRFVLEMPRALAERARFTTLGSGVPEPVRLETAGGARVRAFPPSAPARPPMSAPPWMSCRTAS